MSFIEQVQDRLALAVTLGPRCLVALFLENVRANGTVISRKQGGYV